MHRLIVKYELVGATDIAPPLLSAVQPVGCVGWGWGKVRVHAGVEVGVGVGVGVVWV